MFVTKGENAHTENVGDRVLFYGGEFGYCFSNFAAFSVVWRDRVWQTSEHAFQAAAFDDEEVIEMIFAATSAHDALKLAIQYQEKIRPQWEEQKYGIMKDICRTKLTQHPYILKSLITSGTASLVEDSPKDDCWGRGPDWNGNNNLGKIWMELREEIKQAP
jgi:ribA/ribD-fused uncharacterized protein